MEQPRIVIRDLIGQCMEQMKKQLAALAALQENEDEAMDDVLMDAYEKEKAITMELDVQLKDARSRMLN